jgi:hypothetical protein
VKAKCYPSVVDRDGVGDERVARRPADPLSGAICEPRPERLRPARHDSEEHARDARERVAEHDKPLALSEPVAEISREELED